jgi:integrase
MKDFVSKLAHEGLAPSSIATISQLVKGIVASATDANGNCLYPRTWNTEFIDAPIVDPRSQKAPVIASADVTTAVGEGEGQYGALYALLAVGGIRISEALALKVGPDNESSYWDSRQSKLVIRKSMYHGEAQSPKTAAGVREVDLPLKLNDFLISQIGKNRSAGEYLFGGKKSLPLPTAYSRAIAAGIPGFHSFRRFRMTHLENQGVPRGLMDFWMGHAGKDVHARYVRLDKDIKARKEWAERAGLGFDLPKEKVF